MLRFLTTRGHERTLRAVRADPRAPRLELLHYDRAFAERRLARAASVFTDLDRLSAFDLELAAALYRCLAAAGLPVWNDPARVRTRFALLRALHDAGLNHFNAYRVDERVRPARYPVFLRRAAGHGPPVSDLLADWELAQRAVASALERGIPESDLLLVEYAAEPVRPGVFRRLAISRIGPRLVPHVGVHDARWLVKYGTPGAATPELYAEEALWLRDSPFAAHVQQAFELAGIEYGRADFGLVGGRVQIYEINTNPTLKPGKPHADAQRRENLAFVWQQHLAALRALDPGPLPGPPVALGDPRLRRHQGVLDRYLRRSRATP